MYPQWHRALRQSNTRDILTQLEKMKFSNTTIGLMIVIITSSVLFFIKSSDHETPATLESSRLDKPPDRSEDLRYRRPRSASSDREKHSPPEADAKTVIFAKGGNLTSAAGRQLGLTPEEQLATQEALSEFWAEVSELVAKRVIYDQINSERLGDGYHCYRIPAFPEETRTELFEKLSIKLRDRIADEPSSIIIKGAKADLSFASFGKYDAFITTEPAFTTVLDPLNPSDPGYQQPLPGKRRAKFEFVSPETGTTSVRGDSGFRELNEMFHGIFEK